MKMYEGVLKRVKQLEEKNGIKYSKTDGKLFTSFKVINVLAFIWTVIMNFLYIIYRFIHEDHICPQVPVS